VPLFVTSMRMTAPLLMCCLAGKVAVGTATV